MKLLIRILFFGMLILFHLGSALAEGTAAESSSNKIIPLEHFPPVPQGVAIVSRISDVEVVLFDRLYKLSTDSIFYSRDGYDIPLSWIQKNDRVGYVLNENSEILYLIKQK